MKNRLIGYAVHVLLFAVPGAVAIVASYLDSKTTAIALAGPAALIVRELDKTFVEPWLAALGARYPDATDPVDPTDPPAAA